MLERWRARPRGSRVADLGLAAVVLLLAVALAVNSAADVRQNRRLTGDRRVMNDYLVAYAGGSAQFGSKLYIRSRRGRDLVCAFLRHSNGGLCLHLVRRSGRIFGEYPCVNLPSRAGPPPKGQHWCPRHPKKVT